MQTHRISSSAVSMLFAAIYLSCGAIPLMAQQTAPTPRTLTVTGHASTTMIPDGSTFIIDVAHEDKTPEAAIGAVDSAQAKIVSVLSAVGVPAADVTVIASSLAPIDGGSFSGTFQELVSLYHATRQLQITVRDNTRLPASMAAALPAGTTHMGPAIPRFSNYAQVWDKTLALAVTSARQSADAIAAAANIKIVGIISIRTPATSPPPRASDPTGSAPQRNPTDLKAGSHVLEFDVTITYEISGA